MRRLRLPILRGLATAALALSAACSPADRTRAVTVGPGRDPAGAPGAPDSSAGEPAAAASGPAAPAESRGARDPEEVVEALARSLERDPMQPGAHVELGNALKALGHHEEALAHYDESLRLAPREAATHFNRGLTLMLLERYAEGEQALDRALALAPPGGEVQALALYNLAVLREEHQGRRGEAYELLDRSLELAPDHFDAQRYLGILYHRDERLPEAIAAYRKALALDPEDARAVFYLGEALVATGDKEGAEEQLEKLKQLKHLSMRRLAREIAEMEG